MYLTTTSGVIMNIHYCMGRLASINYGAKQDNSCGQCGMEQKKDCCHTEHQLIKTDDKHLLVKQVVTPGFQIAVVQPLYAFLTVPSLSGRDHYNSLYHSPPDRKDHSFAIFHGVFRI